ncbi:hypothetical protein POM88_031164 [Heracleum sosnowskyi]|uniref:Iron-sulphur binding protein LdpA C-terminal domain-containing protein n=1 Tax=Heracleum sosnowskyi TaxID=360622 RepID=A0AAD8MIW0_9APIA|nr:hypothetical protein POM88_031164 [Heracleum sosnowskyi]
MPQKRFDADALGVVTVCLVALFVVFGLFCIVYSIYFRPRVRRQGFVRLRYFSGPWIIRIIFILLAIWWGVDEIIRLNLLRSEGRILNVNFEWQRIVCKGYIVSNLGRSATEFDGFDEEQFMAMFIDDTTAVPTVSCSNPSSPSDHSSMDDDKHNNLMPLNHDQRMKKQQKTPVESEEMESASDGQHEAFGKASTRCSAKRNVSLCTRKIGTGIILVGFFDSKVYALDVVGVIPDELWNVSYSRLGSYPFYQSQLHLKNKNLRSTSPSSTALIGGVAYGGYARKIVGRIMNSMQALHGHAFIEDHPEHLVMALTEAIALVGPIKCYPSS